MLSYLRLDRNLRYDLKVQYRSAKVKNLSHLPLLAKFALLWKKLGERSSGKNIYGNGFSYQDGSFLRNHIYQSIGAME